MVMLAVTAPVQTESAKVSNCRRVFAAETLPEMARIADCAAPHCSGELSGPWVDLAKVMATSTKIRSR